MSYSDLVVLLEPGADTAGPYAISLATQFEAHLTGLTLVVDPTPPSYAYIEAPYEALQEARDRAISDANETLQGFAAACSAAGVSAETDIIEADLGVIERAVEKAIRHYDLTIIQQSPPDQASDRDLLIEAALFGSGRPVLIVPYIQKGPAKLDTVVVAWDASLVAARAVGDALPLLKSAKSVEVVSVVTERGDAPELPGLGLVKHLARHGIKAELRQVQDGGNVGDTLLSHAADTSADLIVMGGYGHSRLREFVLGGATRRILQSMTVPVLLSH